MDISSSAFKDEDPIPKQYTCDGEDISPPLSLRDVPDEAESLALIVDDPDAPGGTFVHWVIWNLSSDLDSIPSQVPQEEVVSSLQNARQGRNDFGVIGYRGPCPPSGSAHHYRFQLYALDQSLDLAPGATKQDLNNAMNGSVLAQASLTGLYSR